ncbi:MAG: hypothetical protein HQL31_04965, partial [Planctomycetes bacterium]|nr:hypothetical protein [Planctomycetota bacterium]
MEVLKNCLQILALSLVAITATGYSEPRPPAKLVGNTVETERHVITLTTSGLPAQIVIKPSPSELPLPWQGADKHEASATGLKEIGRGEQLRAPLRLVASVAGKNVDLAPASPCIPKQVGGDIECTSMLQAGALKASLTLRYDPQGAIHCRLGYGGDLKIDSLELVFDLMGRVDTLIVGAAVAEKIQAYSPAEFSTGTVQGLIWGNSASDAKQHGRAAPGLVRHLFLGSGDRGFTWLLKSEEGWLVDPEKSTMTLERGKDGEATWRIKFVNTASTLNAEKNIEFSILVHPAKSRAIGHREAAWLTWP